MPRFNTNFKDESEELEKQQKEMLSQNKEEINVRDIELLKDNECHRLTLRLPKDVFNSMKLIGKFEDLSVTAIINKACIEYLAKDENQTKIKKYNKLLSSK
ncbi:MAG: hypothetical protein IJS58_08950 [Bacilli bacterium]|nr:hypothetical protein [Bacilli bacterium]